MALKVWIPSNIYDEAFLRNYHIGGLNPVTTKLTNLTECINMKVKFQQNLLQ